MSGEPTRVVTPSRMALGDLLAELLGRTREILDVRDGLWKLIEAVVSVASAELSLASVLHRIVTVARDMVDAQYAALGVIADTGGLREFVHAGIDAGTVERIGHLPAGHGILGLLIRDPQVLRLDELSEHPSSVGFPEHHPPMDSFLGVPIEVRGRIYGNLYLTNRRDGLGFTDDDIELITTLAAVAGVAIDNARLHEEALRRQQWLEATGDVIGELLGGGDTMQVLALLAARGRELANAATAMLVFVADDGLMVAAADGRHADELLGQRFEAEGTRYGEIMDTGRAIALDNLAEDQRTDQPLAAVGGFGPAMYLPLMARGRRLGTLTIVREKGQPAFGDDDLRLAESFAAQSALALDYGDAQAERRRVAVFNERERIGHDLHDLVIQRLSTAGLALQGVMGQVTDPMVARRIEHTVDQLDAAIGDLRSSIFDLRARRSGASYLSRQIGEICSMAEAMLGFAPRCHVDADVDGLVSEEVAPEVLAVVRMALTNIGRDAQATQVDVSLRVDGDMVSIEVIGNGHDTGPMEQHSDVVDMRSRAERLNGTMDIGHIDGGGTCLTWRVPVGEM